MTISGFPFPDFSLSDDTAATFSDVSVGLSIAASDTFSAFLCGNYQFDDDYEAYAGRAGLRFNWEALSRG